MDHDFLVCPLCGFEFERVDTLCRHGCPMRTTCGLVRCPSCAYEFPERPRAVSWLKRIFRRDPDAGRPVCDRIRTVEELESGERAEVVSLQGESSRRNRLAVFGLAPGSEITLLQRRPTFVVRVGETELALDGEIARNILVRRP